MNEIKIQIQEFIAHQVRSSTPVAIITSGGTTAPLEQKTVRFLDNFSAGTRGSASCELFLKNGYSCIFLHRKYSLEPYSRRFLDGRHSILDILEFDSDLSTVVVDKQHSSVVTEALLLHQHAVQNTKLLKLHFITVDEYLAMLELVTTAVQVLDSSAFVYLAAAVSDYYIPHDQQQVNKIQSGGPLVLELQPVPKMIGPLVETWCPKAFVVSFKLETDPNLIKVKAIAALNKYKHQCVVGNILETRKDVVWIYDAMGGQEEIIRETSEIEDCLVSNLIARHKKFMNK